MSPLDVIDDASALVFADWLQQHGDPWGERIAMKLRGLPVELPAPITGAVWKHGLFDRVQIGGEPEQIVDAARTVLAWPVCGRVDQITFGPVRATFDVWNHWEDSPDHVIDPWTDEVLAQLAAIVPPTVTKLGFGPRPPSAAAGYVRVPGWNKLSHTFPRATELELVGFSPVGMYPLELSELRSLVVKLAWATDLELHAIGECKLPALERLEVGTGGSTYATIDTLYPAHYRAQYPKQFPANEIERMSAWDDMPGSEVSADGIAMLVGTAWPKLAHLSLASSALYHQALVPLFESPLLRQLATLDLSSCNLHDDDIPGLVAAAAQLKQVEVVDLSRNTFTAGGVRRLREALPNAVITNERSGLELTFRQLATRE
ncbi:MAG: hypothetical protein QM831_14970 [Kofleriaceae bacterium]